MIQEQNNSRLQFTLYGEERMYGHGRNLNFHLIIFIAIFHGAEDPQDVYIESYSGFEKSICSVEQLS